MWKNRLDSVFSARADHWLRTAYLGLCLLAVVNSVAFAVVSALQARASGTPVVITSPAAGSTVNAASSAITGTGPAGERIYLTVDGVPQANAITINGSGQWTAGSGTLTEGSHTIKAVLVEGNGLLNHRSDLHAGAKIDLNSKAAVAFTAGLSQPNMAALDETHNRLFVSDGTPYLKVYNSQTNALVGSVNTANAVWPQVSAVSAMLYDAGRGSLYVFTSFEALVVDPSTLAITSRVGNPSQNLYGIAASPASAKVYVYGVNSSDPLRVYDRDTHTYLQLSGLDGVANMKFASDGATAYFNYWSSNTTVRTLNPATDAAGGVTFANANSLSDFAPGIDGTRLYTVDNNAKLRVFNTSTGALVSSLASVGFGPLRVNPAGTKVITTQKVYDIAGGTAAGSMFAGKEFVDPTGTYTYAVLSNGSDVGDSIGIYDAAGTLVKTLSGLRPGPLNIIFASSSAKAYVMSPANGSISVIDTTAQTVAATIEPDVRHSISYVTLPDGSKSYALAPGGSVIQRVNASTGAVLANIQLPGTVEYQFTYQPLALNASGSSLYVLARTLPSMASPAQVRLVKISTASDTVVSSTLLSASLQAWSLAVDETAGLAYASNVTSGGVAAITLSSGAVTTYLAGSLAQPGKVVLSADGTKLYVMDWAASGHVYQVDLASHAVTATANLQGTGRDLAASADGSVLYATMHDSGLGKTYLWKLNAATLASQATKELVNLGTSYPGVTVAPSGVVFVMAEENLFTLDAATLAQYADTDLRSGAYDQPNDLLLSNHLALDPSSYYYSEDSKTFTIVPPPVSITTSSLRLATIQYAYSAQLSSANATGSVTWTLDSGSLPAGLSLSSTGGISGTPTVAGASTFTVRATDSRSTDTKQLTLTVWPNPIGFADDLLGHLDGSGQILWDEWDYDNGAGVTNLQGMDMPTGAVTDPVYHRLYVADCGNNRVMEFDLDVANHLLDRDADHVLGQLNLSGSGSATTQAGLDCSFNTAGLAFDAARGYLFVADPGNNRVVVFDTTGLSDGMNASYVLGQSGFTASSAALTQTGLDTPNGLAFDDATKYLYVADSNNDRVMAFDTTAISSGLPAAHVLGQASFTADSTTVAQNTTHAPTGVTVDVAGKRLFVADAYNSRVLIFSTASLSDGENATAVLGQDDFVSSAVAGVTQQSLMAMGLAYDAVNQRLFAADLQGNRVMVFDVASPTNNQPAMAVIGQDDFTSSVYDTTQFNFDSPGHVWFEAGSHQLFIPDMWNNRVMIYSLLMLGAGSLGDGQAGSAYGGSVGVSHAQGTVSYGVQSGSLPPGLSLSSGGALTGTPTTAGTYTFAVRASDDIGTEGIMIDTHSYTVTIAAAAQAPQAPQAPATPTPTPAPSSPTSTPTPGPTAEPEVVLLNEEQSYAGSEGAAHELSEGQVVTFVLDGTSTPAQSGTESSSGQTTHSVTVAAVGADYCDLVIRSEPIHLRLKVGESRDVDADQDGQNDIRVKLAGIAAGHAQLIFRALAVVPTVTPSPSASPRATASASPAPAPSPAAMPTWALLAGGAMLVVILMGAAGWWIWRRH